MIRPVNGSGMKRTALLNDLSCFGKCSLSVLMPILSSFGVETVPLPTALLSTHTADGFGDYVLRDTLSEMRAFTAHWRALGLRFDSVCTGFFASSAQIDFARTFLREFAPEGTLRVVDPVLGDSGALYSCFSEDYVKALRVLCGDAQLITPNHTEAALLADCPMDTEPKELLRRLTVENVIITSVHRGGEIGYAARFGGEYAEVFKPCLPQTLHGTGDVFTSALLGNLLAGRTMEVSLFRAADFCDRCIQKTLMRGETHWYALAFEDVLREERER